MLRVFQNKTDCPQSATFRGDAVQCGCESRACSTVARAIAPLPSARGAPRCNVVCRVVLDAGTL